MRATAELWCSSEPSVSQFSSPTEPSLEKEASSFHAGGLNQLTGRAKPTEGLHTWKEGDGTAELGFPTSEAASKDSSSSTACDEAHCRLS